MTPIEWLLGDDTGISSKTICAVMTESELSGPFAANVPGDADDFGRCYRLLQHFPEWRDRLPEVAARYPIWGPMIAAWDELTFVYERLCDVSGRLPLGRGADDADRIGALGRRIAELKDQGRIADGWVCKGPGWWTRPGRDVGQAEVTV